MGLIETEYLKRMGMVRYGVNEKGEVEWTPSKSTLTWFCDDAEKLAEFLRFHRREAAKGLLVYGSSKGAAQRQEGIRSITTIIPPLIVEQIDRSKMRRVLVVTCNLVTFNDRNGLDLPPNFEYELGSREIFKKVALSNLEGMVNFGIKLSPLFMRMLPTAYQDNEEEGEDMASSSNSSNFGEDSE